MKRTEREKGAALVLALFLIVILTVMGLGLVLRTRVTMAVAGAERPMTKNFYAADSGVHASYARLQLNNPCPFTFNMQDTRRTHSTSGDIEFPILVTIQESRQVGLQQEVGSMVGGAMGGGGQRMPSPSFRLNADAFEAATDTRRAVEAEVYFDPKPVTIMPPC